MSTVPSPPQDCTVRHIPGGERHIPLVVCLIAPATSSEPHSRRSGICHRHYYIAAHPIVKQAFWVPMWDCRRGGPLRGGQYEAHEIS
eukprot:2564328-Rhodomonas_salina.1